MPACLVRPLLVLVLTVLPAAAWAVGECRFPKRPPLTLKPLQESGPCGFDIALSSFAGTPEEQALCLLTPVLTGGRLGVRLHALPPALHRVGSSDGLPERDLLQALLRERGLEPVFGNGLSHPVSHAHDDDPLSRSATYFVIHDTSSPNFLNRPWPDDIDTDRSINNLKRYACSNNIERAHIFINRGGEIFNPHDFSVPWRATKFETVTNFAHALRGLFLHVELVQPRRRHPKYRGRNDFLAPDPGFPPAQYDALALVYVVASVRAGFWLIPAYHAVLDEGIFDKHDDPQNFDLDVFAESVARLRTQLEQASCSRARQC